MSRAGVPTDHAERCLVVMSSAGSGAFTIAMNIWKRSAKASKPLLRLLSAS